MALVIKDRVQQASSYYTTGSFSLNGTVSGFQSFSVIGNGNQTYYSATDSTGNWEVGLGTYDGNTSALSRDLILSSSNSGLVTSFSGTVNVLCTYPAEYALLGSTSAVASTGSGDVVLNNDPTLTLQNATGLPVGGITATGTPSSTTYLRGDSMWSSAINGISIGATTASTGRFTTVTSTVATGTAPLTVASTTNVANLNASSLNGATFASPGAIGGTTAAAGTFTTLISTNTNYIYQPAPTAVNATNTLTIAQLLTGIITTTSTTAVTLTMPTGTDIDAGILSGLLPANQAFEWVVINLGSASGAVTMNTAGGSAITGALVVPTTTSARFRTRKTGTNTFVTYRVN